MKRVVTLLSISFVGCMFAQEQWITVLVHGSIGLGANFNGRTISLIKKDCIEGSRYERTVKTMRQNPYVHSLQPLGPFGLHPVAKKCQNLDGAVIFTELYSMMCSYYAPTEQNTFYTYGWSGLISEKERQRAARAFYIELRSLIEEKKNANEQCKIRLIGYSHGGTMFSKFAQLREKEFCNDTFTIDETILVGVPITECITSSFACAPFTRVYNIYSKADKVQRLDIFTSSYFLSQRTFTTKQSFPQLTQIEFCYTACLKPLPGKILPSRMRGIITQSPGHVEWWSFGWARSMYRRTLDMYPCSAALFIPYLIFASKKLTQPHLQVDLRPYEEQAYVQASCCSESPIRVPFLTCEEYGAFLNKACDFYEEKRELFKNLEASLDLPAYQYAS